MLYSYLFTTIGLIFGLHFYKNRYPKEYEMIITQFIDNVQKNEILKSYLPILTTTFYTTYPHHKYSHVIQIYKHRQKHPNIHTCEPQWICICSHRYRTHKHVNSQDT